MNGNVKKIVRLLKKEYSENKIELKYRNTLELLVATVLSAQCTDVRVNKVTPVLFEKYQQVKDYAAANSKVLEEEIKSTGFYRNKTKNIIACCKEILERYKGNIPNRLEDLVKLPGIGRKTANVVLGNAFGVPGIVVDTHVKRLSYRMGLTENKDPVKIEYDLMKVVTKEDWVHFSNAMVLHGRQVCFARKPKCFKCTIKKHCLQVGVK